VHNGGWSVSARLRHQANRSTSERYTGATGSGSARNPMLRVAHAVPILRLGVRELRHHARSGWTSRGTSRCSTPRSSSGCVSARRPAVERNESIGGRPGWLVSPTPDATRRQQTASRDSPARARRGVSQSAPHGAQAASKRSSRPGTGSGWAITPSPDATPNDTLRGVAWLERVRRALPSGTRAPVRTIRSSRPGMAPPGRLRRARIPNAVNSSVSRA
jgi:hypothetical protein